MGPFPESKVIAIAQVCTQAKKNDVAKCGTAFRHVGLFVNKPPGQNRVALCLVIRRLPVAWYPVDGLRQHNSMIDRAFVPSNDLGCNCQPAKAGD